MAVRRIPAHTLKMWDPCSVDRAAHVAPPGPVQPSLLPAPHPLSPPGATDPLSSPGRSLDDWALERPEAGFGRDFSHIRVDSGQRAAQSARTVTAAYATGRDVLSGQGTHAMPRTPAPLRDPRGIATAPSDRVSGHALRENPGPAVEAPVRLLAPRAAHETLAGAGRLLDAPVRERMEALLGHDLSRVRVHADAQAAGSARAVGAAAYTVGSDIVFGAGRYAPRTSAGQGLLAHELAHTVQQRNAAPGRQLSMAAPDHPAERQADRAAAGERIAPSVVAATLMRRTIFDSIGGLFKGDDFPKAGLDTYVATLDKTGVIEDFNESDNKARAVVTLWAADRTAFALTPRLKALLIQEMLSGATLDDDERGILTLLNTAGFTDLTYIFGAGGVIPERLNSKIDGAENDQLRVFLTSRFEGTFSDIISGSGRLRQLPTPYQTPSLPRLLDDRASEIARALAGIADTDERDLKLRHLAQTGGQELAAEIAKIASPDHEKAINDLAVERATRDDVFEATKRDIDIEHERETSDAAHAATHKANVRRLEAENERRWASIVVLDVALSGIAAAVALQTPKADLAKQVSSLTATQQSAAQDAIKPTVVATQPGAPPPAFVKKLPGEALAYKDKLRARAQQVVNTNWNNLAKNRTATEHVKQNLHPLDELEVIANAAAREVDQVFGSYKTAAPFKADKFDTTGKLVTPGNIHDVWQSEEAKGHASPAYRAGSAAFWMFYLLQNDDEVKTINFKHNARPSLKEDHNPLNPEGSDLAAAANARLAIPAEVKRLFEIGRAWDAFNVTGEVSVQTFRGKTEADDRRFLWDMFFTLMHEYLHSLSALPYQGLETKLGGEATDEGNTLIEGVDSYLTEIVWTHALPRASLPAVRNAVEPEYVNKGRPFDAGLLPVMPHRRYANYDKAAKLVSIVGIKNVYAAYFLGDVKAIGQTPPP